MDTFRCLTVQDGAERNCASCMGPALEAAGIGPDPQVNNSGPMSIEVEPPSHDPLRLLLGKRWADQKPSERASSWKVSELRVNRNLGL
jgi:hypothetical protein